MKTVWRITKKDLLCFRWPIVAWLLFLALGLTAFPAWQLPFWDAAFLQYGVRQVFLNADKVALLFGLVFVLLSVSADSVPDAQAYWLTRPVRPASVLGAKILGVALVVVLPLLLVESAIWYWTGLGPDRIARQACTLVAGHGAMLFVSIPLSLVLSLGKGRNGQARTAITGGLFAAILVVFVASLICQRRAEYGRLESSALAMSAVAGLASVWLVYDLYWRRGALGSAAAGLVLVCLMLFAGFSWPWNFVRSSTLKKVAPAPELKLQAEAFVREGIRQEGDIGAVSLVSNGLPGDSRLSVSIVEGLWTEEGRAFAVAGSGNSTRFSPDTASRSEAGASLKVRTVERYDRGRPAVGTGPGNRARFEGVLRLLRADPSESYRLQLSDGARLGKGRMRARLVRLELNESQADFLWKTAGPEGETPFGRRHFLLDTVTGSRVPLSLGSVSQRFTTFGVACAENRSSADLRLLLGDGFRGMAALESGRLAIVEEEYAWTATYVVPFAAEPRARPSQPPSKVSRNAP